VIIEWTGGGTFRGEFAGHAPNGRSFTLKGCGFFHVVDGLIRSQRGYWDKTTWFSQLDIPLRITSPRGRGRQICTAMNAQSRRFAGILLVVLPTVMIGGVSLLSLLLWEPAYAANPLRQDLWRAGHAHAGVLLVLSLIALRYVDEARLSEAARWFVRLSVPAAAILLPAAFFLSVLSPTAQQPNGIIYLAFIGAALLAAGVLTLGVGLIRAGNQHEQK
jgi:hypothetical protein